MKESILNTIIKNSFLFGTKFPDPSKADVLTASKRPFDGVGVRSTGVVFYETKLLKSYSALSFTAFKDHQIFNLTLLENIAKEYGLTYKSVYLVGIYVPRKSLNLFCFTPSYVNAKIADGKKSILKKEFLDFEEKGLFLEKEKDGYDFAQLDEVLIGEAKIL